MHASAKSTILFAVWVIVYMVIGGAVLIVSGELLRRTAMDDLLAIFVSVVLAAIFGWLAASWVQRRVAGDLSRQA